MELRKCDGRTGFDKVVVRKPKSSRDRSSEVYLLGAGFRPLSDGGVIPLSRFAAGAGNGLRMLRVVSFDGPLTGREETLNNLFKNLAIWLVIGIVLMTVFNQFSTRQVAQNTLEYSQFLDEVKAGRIAKVVIQGRTLEATTTKARRSSPMRRPTCGW
jgi:hypothetical protein